MTPTTWQRVPYQFRRVNIAPSEHIRYPRNLCHLLEPKTKSRSSSRCAGISTLQLCEGHLESSMNRDPQTADGGAATGGLVHALKIACLLFLNQSPGITNSTCPGSPSNTMHVLTHIHGCIIINNMRHVFDIYASRYEIRANQPKNQLAHGSQARDQSKHVDLLRPEFTQN